MQIKRRSWTTAGVLAGITALLLPSLCMGDNNAQITNASRQVRDAQSEVSHARQQMAQARMRVAASVQGKPEWAAAMKQFRSAQAAFAAIKKQTMAELRKAPDYVSLVNDRLKAQDLLAQADGSDSNVTDQQIRHATGIVVQDGLKFRQMEDEAFARAPGYNDAKNNLQYAQQQMDQFDAEVTQQAQGNPDYQQAAKDVDSAEKKLSQARLQLAQAVQADRQQREQEAKAREQQATYGQ